MHGGVVAGSPQGPVEHTEKVWTKPNRGQSDLSRRIL